MALPTALFATVASLGLASVAVMSSVNAQHGSKRDSGSKNAIAAADSGANLAMMRLERVEEDLSEENPCLGPNGEKQTPTNGWCPKSTPETVGGSTYSYQFSAIGGEVCEGHELCVVVTGSASEVARRVLISFDRKGDPGSGGESEEEEGEEEEGEDGGSGGIAEGLIGKEEVTMSGNADVRVGVGTDGYLVTSGNTSICGGIRHGIGKSWKKSGNASQCSGYNITEGNVELPPVSSFIPSDIATKNSNGRITMCSKGLPLECQADTYNGKWSSTSPLNPSNRQIQLSGNTVLTLGGGDYWLCSMSLSGNSKLIMAEGAHVRLFFDTPEKCGTTSQINLSGNNEISATGYQPGEDQFDVPGIYLLGSPTMTSTVNLSGNYSNTFEFVLYGPDTNINISGNATMKGLIAGKRIAISGNGRIENDEGFELPPELNPWKEDEGDPGEEEDEEGEPGSPGIFAPQFYIECSATTSSVPDANC